VNTDIRYNIGYRDVRITTPQVEFLLNRYLEFLCHFAVALAKQITHQDAWRIHTLVDIGIAVVVGIVSKVYANHLADDITYIQRLAPIGFANVREKIVRKIIVKLCPICFMVVVFIDANHNLDERILCLFLCVNITGVFATRHQFIDDTLVLLAIRIIHDVPNNLAVAQDAKCSKDYEDGNLATNERCVNAYDASHVIQLTAHIKARGFWREIRGIAH
jgi:hypothetical protein